MAKSKKGANNQVALTRALDIPGLQFSKDGTSIAFDSQDLPASEHFFRSNCYSVVMQNGELDILFGQQSSFSPDIHLRAAAEISFPVGLAVEFLYNVIWVNPSMNGTTTFADVVNRHIETSDFFDDNSLSKGRLEEGKFELPSNPSTYRAFSSNNAATALAQGQGMIEFFEASPNLIANLAHGRKLRKSDGLKSVIAIILPPEVLRNFFIDMRELLEPFAERKKEKEKKQAKENETINQ